MIRIPCPHCGLRNSSEFRHTGEAPQRPDPNASTPQEWRSYLYDKQNPAGPVIETWYHAMGCRRFVTVERDRTTNQTRPVPRPGAHEEPSPGGGDHADSAGVTTGRML